MNVIERARAWVVQDPDPDTRAELEHLIAENDVAALEERFTGELRFGTAGLRGLLGAGPNRMNRVTVARATAGLCAWLERQVPDARSRGICIGRDARPKSDVFERDVIEVAAAVGIPVWVFTDVVPTPVLAFAVLRRKAAAGVMITASHNPRGYNGYKVYWENGAQIIPPHDRGISSEIARASEAAAIPRRSIEEARAAGLVREIDSVHDDYVATIAGEVAGSLPRAPLRIAYTALHGVAERTCREVLSRAGFDDVHSVAEQSMPDGSFPTVVFPNPEEPGAMDRVVALGERVDADLVLANDPDGDRLAAAVRDEASFEQLSGNDIGLLLADDLLRRNEPGTRPVVLSTVVSSPMLGPIARSHGALWEQTLTGHKWIQNRALELERDGYTYVFGYEEALGYSPSAAVRDKDGISSALRLADLAARLKQAGRTLLDAREALWREHGFVADRQVSVRFEGREAQREMTDTVARLRRHPPREIGGREVVQKRELTGDVLIFDLRGGHQAMVRPSGTEPKLKYYFYAADESDGETDLDSIRVETEARLADMIEDLTATTGC